MALKNKSATSLIGGGSGALDSIDGTNLTDLDSAMVFTAETFYFYILDADSATSESSPDIISPDANAGNKRWILIFSMGVLGTITLSNTGLHLLDTGGNHDLIIKPGSDVSADRTLTLTTGNSDRTITLSGNPTLGDWFDQAVKAASSPTFAGITLGNTGLHILDTDASHDLIIKPGSDLDADKTLTLTTGNVDRTITLSGNPTLSDWFDQALKAASSPTFAALTLTTDLAVAHGGTGASDAANALINLGLTATSTEINKACDLTSNGFFTTGNANKMLFYLDTAPTGWSIDTGLDDKLVFITKGSGASGETGGQAHSTGTWTQPNHDHEVSGDTGVPSALTSAASGANTPGAPTHTHSISFTSAGGATANTWRPAAYNCIVASLD